MSNASRLMSLPPFPPGYRASGLLLHVTSLPPAYGIGDVGPAAFAWIDRLRGAGQNWWQSLPLAIRALRDVVAFVAPFDRESNNDNYVPQKSQETGDHRAPEDRPSLAGT